jgi:hypothetical protein
VLSALETGPTTLAGLVAATGLARRPPIGLPSPSSIIVWSAGICKAGSYSARAWASWPQRPVRTDCWQRLDRCCARLRDITGESAQMFRRQGDYRVCVCYR